MLKATKIVRALILVVAIAAVVAALPAAAQAGDAESGWRVDFVENPQLPSTYRQGGASRADGSVMTYFVGGAGESRDGRKPLLVWLDGSGAQSLFLKLPDGRIASGMYALIAGRAGEQYHVAGVEKRGVEFGDGSRPGSGEGASAEYTAHATLDDRVADVRLLLDTLLGDPMVDASRVVLVGHSEGADVAAAAAAADARVTHVAFLSGGGAAQLFDFFILRRKMMAEAGASPEAIERAIVELEKEIRDVLADPNSEQRFWMGHAYKRWSTFATQASADNLVKAKAKVFAAHGSEDASVPIESFDFLVLELLRQGRADATIRRYAGVDHGFAKPGEPPTGEQFTRVLDQVLAWAGSGESANAPTADDEVVLLYDSDRGGSGGGKAKTGAAADVTLETSLACNADALTAAEQAERSKLVSRLKSSMRVMRGLDDGYEFELPPAGDMATAIATFIDLERRCCPFLRFALEFAPAGGAVRLRITGPEGVKPLIEAELKPGGSDTSR